MNDPGSAEQIAKRLLDQTGIGIATGDFDLFVACFALPLEIETFDGRRHLETIADIRGVFDAVRAHQEKMGVTDMVRHIVTAEFRDPSTISYIHQTRLVSGSTLIQKPYNVYSVAQLEGSEWRVHHSQYAVDDSPSLCRALVGDQRKSDA